MKHQIDPTHGAMKPTWIAHVADDVAERWVLARHLPLLLFVAAVDANLFGLELRQMSRNTVTEGARSSSDEDRGSFDLR